MFAIKIWININMKSEASSRNDFCRGKQSVLHILCACVGGWVWVHELGRVLAYYPVCHVQASYFQQHILAPPYCFDIIS